MGNLLGLCIASMILHRKKDRILRDCLVALVCFALVCLPWLVFARPWHQSRNIGLHEFGPKFFYYLSELHYHIVPLVVFLIPPAIYFWEKVRRLRQTPLFPENGTEILLWTLIPAHLVILAATVGSYFRYLTPLIPVLILMASAILVRDVKPPIFSYLVVGMLCLSNAISVYSLYPFRGVHSTKMQLAQFVREIASDYEDRLEDVVFYLSRNANPSQSVYVYDPEFPLIFYTDMRVIDARFNNRLDRRDLPDWIFPESASGLMPSSPIRVPRALIAHYKPVSIRVHDTARNASRPDPDLHKGFTSSEYTKMLIYRKIQ
jgi:hypothetical protein